MDEKKSFPIEIPENARVRVKSGCANSQSESSITPLPHDESDPKVEWILPPDDEDWKKPPVERCYGPGSIYDMSSDGCSGTQETGANEQSAEPTPLKPAITAPQNRPACPIVQNLTQTPLRERHMRSIASALTELVKANDSSRLIKQIIAEDLQPPFSLPNGDTLLHLAVLHQATECLKLLTDFGADPDAENQVGFTPLMVAVIRENELMANRLISCGAKLTYLNSTCMTPLMLAAYLGSSRMILVLHRYAAPLNQSSPEGLSALAWAALGNHAESVRLLVRLGAEVEGKNRTTPSPLMWAASNGADAAVEVLYELGADLFHSLLDSGHCAKQLAARENQTTTVELLARLRESEIRRRMQVRK